MFRYCRAFDVVVTYKRHGVVKWNDIVVNDDAKRRLGVGITSKLRYGFLWPLRSYPTLHITFPYDLG